MQIVDNSASIELICEIIMEYSYQRGLYLALKILSQLSMPCLRYLILKKVLTEICKEYPK